MMQSLQDNTPGKGSATKVFLHPVLLNGLLNLFKTGSTAGSHQPSLFCPFRRLAPPVTSSFTPDLRDLHSRTMTSVSRQFREVNGRRSIWARLVSKELLLNKTSGKDFGSRPRQIFIVASQQWAEFGTRSHKPKLGSGISALLFHVL
jgi:hypothetical protein